MDPLENKWRDASWRRRLTPAEEAELRAWLAGHPDAQADWEMESGLAKVLEQLPAAPVPSNFTARVLQAIEQDECAGRRTRSPIWSWRWILPKAAAAAVALGIGVFSYNELATAKRVELAHSIAAVSGVASLPSPEILQDFETVRQLSLAPAQDDMARSVYALLQSVPDGPAHKSPVDLFRELLALNITERRQLLTNYPAEAQKRLLAKLREYESLKPDERELRLRATELRWYLLPLMSLSRNDPERAARLEQVPADERALVEARLARWEMLPPPLQRDLLNSDTAARYFAQPETSTNTHTGILRRISPERRAKLEAGMDRWRSVTGEQRRQMLESFNQFFELTPREKEKTLNVISDAERRQMEKTLQSYARLTQLQRVQCIRSFEKFAGMSLVDRQQFLKNAERWKMMSPDQRATWRNLVSIAPLLPPEMHATGIPAIPHALHPSPSTLR